MNCANFIANGTRWRHLGPVVLARGPAGAFDCGVVGDPCIVWDPDIGNWRMFYFAAAEQFSSVATGVAVARSSKHVDSGDWVKIGRLPILGPHAELCHKFWVLMSPQTPGQPVRVGDEYLAFFTTLRDGAKVIGRARARYLGGPWHTDAEPVIAVGAADAFDGRGADAVTAYWFADRNQILLFYMAYPAKPQRDQALSPLGPCQAAAVLDPNAAHAEKLGPVLRPGSAARHWCNGWIGGLQLLPTLNQQWVALLNGSATPVREGHGEPDPSVAGWARSEEAFPVSGWRFDLKQSPIELPTALSPAAKQAGEATNFWRHYLLVLPDERVRIYYNSGAYGNEQIYARVWQP
ncbi:MAG TPA: hypothetical protein VL403_16875 [Candidatus Kryptonia bacterium]|nr:hypothetical protein [Candidatus Kryptonia bacterium]